MVRGKREDETRQLTPSGEDFTSGKNPDGEAGAGPACRWPLRRAAPRSRTAPITRITPFSHPLSIDGPPATFAIMASMKNGPPPLARRPFRKIKVVKPHRGQA